MSTPQGENDGDKMQTTKMLPSRAELLFADPGGSFTAGFLMSFIANKRKTYNYD